MSTLAAPSAAISKKTNSRKGKDTKTAVKDLEDSPVNIKLVSVTKSIKMKKVNQVSNVAACNRRLDLSNIDLLALSTNSGALTSVGAVHNAAKQCLEKRNFGKLSVDLTCSVIRWPDEWCNFTFFLFADHSGCVSIASPIETFSCLQEFCTGDTKQSISAVSITGTVNFKWSTRTNKDSGECEIYMTIKKGSATVRLTEASSAPQAFSAFHTMRSIINQPYNGSAQFSYIFGDCVLVQDDMESSRKCFMLQDSTGLAVVNVMNWNFENDEEEIAYRGATLFQGLFTLSVVELNGVPAISATVDRDTCSLVKKRPALLTRHINLVQATEKCFYVYVFI